MVRNDETVGVIVFNREEPGGYSEPEISLLKTFVDQAAIAVDNARLLQEIEQRNVELAESLELQTATSEVLQLISDNPGDLRGRVRRHRRPGGTAVRRERRLDQPPRG